MKAQTKQNTFTISVFLQKVIIIATIGGFLTTATILAYWIASQYPNNDNLSGFLVFGVSALLIPLILFFSAYLTSKTKLKLPRLFEACLFVFIGASIQGIVSQFTSLPFIRIRVFTHSYWQSVALEFSISAFALALYIALLVYYRRTKKA